MIKIILENITEMEFLEILGCNEYPEIGDEVALPCSVSIINTSQDGNKFIDNQVFSFFVQITTDIAIGLFVSYLYDKLKNLKNPDKVKLKIDDKETIIEMESIQIRMARSVNSTVNILAQQEDENGSK